MRDQEWVEFEGCTLLAQTESAGLFQFEDGEVGLLGLTSWICEKKGIEY